MDKIYLVTYMQRHGENCIVVWNHRLRDFCVDYDGAYLEREFAYTSMASAMKRANILLNQFSDAIPVDGIHLYSRKQLFDALNIEDWSHGY